uniref:Uncharacterized protein n=1 Tax=Anguilla anguilla TaxID=7936 RepID=A0A0E9STF8_ANGAN
MLHDHLLSKVYLDFKSTFYFNRIHFIQRKLKLSLNIFSLCVCKLFASTVTHEQ